MMSQRDEINLSEYLHALRRRLAPLPAAERDDIVEEIRMHMRERLAADPMLVLNEVLHRLATPQVLARQYQSAQVLDGAGRSHSPLLLLRATLAGR